MADLFVIGDIHNQFSRLNQVLAELPANSDIVVAGDFGYFPKMPPAQQINSIIPLSHKIYLVPGNHEDWDSLDSIITSTNITEIDNNIFYCPFGSILSHESGNILFCGGAESPDRGRRTPGYDWFPQEGISYTDMMKLPSPSEIPIHTIISHTCPLFCIPLLNLRVINSGQCSSMYLDSVWEIYRPSRWYFGHFHCPASFTERGTQFHSLGHIRQSGNLLKI